MEVEVAASKETPPPHAQLVKSNKMWKYRTVLQYHSFYYMYKYRKPALISQVLCEGEEMIDHKFMEEARQRGFPSAPPSLKHLASDSTTYTTVDCETR